MPILSASSNGPRAKPNPRLMVISIFSWLDIPSISVSHASPISDTISLTLIKPGDSSTITGVLPISLINVSAFSVTSGDVYRPDEISTTLAPELPTENEYSCICP